MPFKRWGIGYIKGTALFAPISKAKEETGMHAHLLIRALSQRGNRDACPLINSCASLHYTRASNIQADNGGVIYWSNKNTDNDMYGHANNFTN
jgi:hypothetical protein